MRIIKDMNENHKVWSWYLTQWKNNKVIGELNKCTNVFYCYLVRELNKKLSFVYINISAIGVKKLKYNY